jgi:hypothetical protein
MSHTIRYTYISYLITLPNLQLWIPNSLFLLDFRTKMFLLVFMRDISYKYEIYTSSLSYFFMVWCAINEWVTDWLPNCCWPSTSEWMLVRSPTGSMTTLYCLMALYFASYEPKLKLPNKVWVHQNIKFYLIPFLCIVDESCRQAARFRVTFISYASFLEITH